MAVQVAIEDLSVWLGNQPENTIDTPYEINVTGLTTTDDLTLFRNSLRYTSRYVDLRETVLPVINLGYDIFAFTFLLKDCHTVVYAPNIPRRITKMDGAFENCISLRQTPIIANTVTHLSGCFAGCTSLTEVNNLPDSAVLITRMCEGCTSLISAPIIPNTVSNMNNCFKDCTSLKYAPNLPIGVTSVERAFQNCTALEYKPVLPSSATYTTDCFKDVTQTRWGGLTSQLESFVANQTTEFDIVEIEEDTENNCYKMTGREIYGVELSNLNTWLSNQPSNKKTKPYEIKVLNVTLFGLLDTFLSKNTKYVDFSYTEITQSIWDAGASSSSNKISSYYLIGAPKLGEGILYINDVYRNCPNLKKVPALPSTILQMISAFEYTGIETPVVIPASVTKVQYAFRYCVNLKTPPSIPSGITDITGLFEMCTKLETAPTIPNSVTKMEKTFNVCSKLTTPPTIPNSVTDLSYAFRNCTSLEKPPVIPSGVTSMFGTFYGCTNLAYVPDIPNTVTDISYAFSGCSKLSHIYNSVTPAGINYSERRDIVIPASVTNATECFKGCTALEEIAEFLIPLNTLKNNANFQNMFQNCPALEQVGHKISVDSAWHVMSLNIGASAVSGKVYGLSQNSVTTTTIPSTNVTKTNLVLPNLTDEIMFPPVSLSDADLEDVISDVLLNKYTWWKREAIDPTQKTFVLYADDPKNVITNISTNIKTYNTQAEAEADLANLSEGQIIATLEGGDGAVDEVTLGDTRCVTSNAVAEMFNTNLNDEEFVNITSQVTCNLGVNNVRIMRKNNFVWIEVTGSYTGSPTTTSQQLIRSIPEKYRPKQNMIGFAFLGYNTSQNAVVARGTIRADGEIWASETSWNNGTEIRIGAMYFVN